MRNIIHRLLPRSGTLDSLQQADREEKHYGLAERCPKIIGKSAAGTFWLVLRT